MMQHSLSIPSRMLLPLAGLVLAACSAVGAPIRDVAGEINATLSEVRRVTEVGDVISVVFPYHTDWNMQSRIRDDGFATFTLIGEIKVVGLSIAELNQRLLENYAKVPDVSELELTADVEAVSSGASEASRVVFVIGDVTNPGSVQMTGRSLTLLEAISSAGGHLKRTANLRDTMLIRRVRGTNEMRSWRLNADVYEWGMHPAIYLQERDVVFVPNTAIDEVDIWVDQYIRQMIPLPGLVPATVTY